MWRLNLGCLTLLFLAGTCGAQSPTPAPTPALQQPAPTPAEKAQSPEEKRPVIPPQPAQNQRGLGTPVIQTPSMRLAAARNVLLVRARGSTIPVEVIRTTIEGWGRFTFVTSPDKADLIIEVASNGDSGVQVSSSSQVSPQTGQEEKSTSSRKDISPTDVRMTVIDARNKRVLWSASEGVKFAMKEKAKENNLVETAERLATKFHDRLEPR